MLVGSAHMAGYERASNVIKVVHLVFVAGDWSWPLEAMIIWRRALKVLGYAVP